MEILTSVKRLYIRFKSLVNDFVYSFGRAALLLLVEVSYHTVPVRERGRIRVIYHMTGLFQMLPLCIVCTLGCHCSIETLKNFSQACIA